MHYCDCQVRVSTTFYSGKLVFVDQPLLSSTKADASQPTFGAYIKLSFGNFQLYWIIQAHKIKSSTVTADKNEILKTVSFDHFSNYAEVYLARDASRQLATSFKTCFLGHCTNALPQHEIVLKAEYFVQHIRGRPRCDACRKWRKYLMSYWLASVYSKRQNIWIAGPYPQKCHILMLTSHWKAP